MSRRRSQGRRVPQRVSIQDWPRLTRFYGIPPSELARMPHALLRLYAEQLFELHAEETLLAFMVADMPYLKPHDRRNARRPFERSLPSAEPEKVDVRTPTGASIAAGMGIGLHLDVTEVESSVEA